MLTMLTTTFACLVTLYLMASHYVVDQEDNELVIASPQVGYVNLPETALYFMRAPARRWKQGLDMRALVCPRGGMRARGMLTNEALVRCIENNYPSFEQAQGMFKSANPFKEHQREGVAFHRDFALRRGPEGMLLCHKGTEVGVVEQGNPVLSMKYGWLTEKLEGVLG